MKKIFLFIIIFVFGAATYAFLNPLLLSLLGKMQPEKTERTVVPTTTVQTVVIPPKVEPEPIVAEKKVTIDEDGAVHDGPFSLYDTDGVKIAGSVQIIRSPEETLLQFIGVTQKHTNDAHIYFATTKTAEKHLDLGIAKLNDDVTVYGMPIDADLRIYKYILLYNPEAKTADFYAEI